MDEIILPKYLTQNADGTVGIKLNTPIEIAGTKIPAVQMREPTINDQLVFEATKGSDAVKEVQLFANLCGHSAEDIKSLTVRDYRRLQAAYGTFTD